MRSRRKTSVTMAVLVVAVLVLGHWLTSLALAAPVTITLWDHHIHDKKFRQNAVKEFNKQNKDVNIKYVSQVSGAYEQTLEASMLIGEMPDIFVPAGKFNNENLVAMGAITSIEDVAPSRQAFQAWVDKFPAQLQPFVETINMFDGKVYSWPNSAEGGRMMLFYNTKLLRQAGLVGKNGVALEPETWADTRDFARKVTALGKGRFYGVVHGLQQGTWGPQILWSLAPSSGWRSNPFYGFDPKTLKFNFHYKGFRGSIQLWLDMKKDGSIMPGDLSFSEEEARRYFATEKGALFFDGPWAPGGLIAYNPDLEFDVVLPPVEERGVRKGYLMVGAVAGTSEYVIWSGTKAPEPALWKAINFLTSREYQEGWVKAGGGLSVFPQYNKPEFFPHITIAKIAQMAITGRRIGPEPVKGTSTVSGYFWEETTAKRRNPDQILSGIWVGKLGMDTWDLAEKEHDAILANSIKRAQRDGVNIEIEDFHLENWDPAENYVKKSKGK
ncbi:MAG: extracellular solute-binding protein [Firmicutes bacterium]|nr:extracellular solute-binding protein [Bacillota bacterium]